jgi:hypothetical protein
MPLNKAYYFFNFFNILVGTHCSAGVYALQSAAPQTVTVAHRRDSLQTADGIAGPLKPRPWLAAKGIAHESFDCQIRSVQEPSATPSPPMQSSPGTPIGTSSRDGSSM